VGVAKNLEPFQHKLQSRDSSFIRSAHSFRFIRLQSNHKHDGFHWSLDCSGMTLLCRVIVLEWEALVGASFN